MTDYVVPESSMKMKEVPLSDDEERAWRLLVEEGERIRAPIIARREERKAESLSKVGPKAAESILKMRAKSKANSMKDLPVSVKRWVVARMAGISFRKAGEASGASWIDIQDAKARNEEFRCAFAAMEENSRQLIKAKAQSVIEQSQEEDAKVSLAQTQVSMRILESLDREHFGEMPKDQVAEEVQKQLGGGGFVINLIGDAAKVAEAVPVKKPGKALVYTDV